MAAPHKWPPLSVVNKPLETPCTWVLQLSAMDFVMVNVMTVVAVAVCALMMSMCQYYVKRAALHQGKLFASTPAGLELMSPLSNGLSNEEIKMC